VSQKAAKSPNLVRLNSHQLLKETLERVRRPPEAPPLSFDERRYRTIIQNRQQRCDTFLKKSAKRWVWTDEIPAFQGFAGRHRSKRTLRPQKFTFGASRRRLVIRAI
ncbi:hypothetical protein, partial [Shinella sumterensis]|uniref:hypothetical protein n=1 Tax=Shinella sumterensis TaxID=1967501 RepID=UPI003F8750E2